VHDCLILTERINDDDDDDDDDEANDPELWFVQRLVFLRKTGSRCATLEICELRFRQYTVTGDLKTQFSSNSVGSICRGFVVQTEPSDAEARCSLRRTGRNTSGRVCQSLFDGNSGMSAPVERSGATDDRQNDLSILVNNSYDAGRSASERLHCVTACGAFIVSIWSRRSL